MSSAAQERESIKVNLKTWWSNFTKSGKSGAGGRERSKTFTMASSPSASTSQHADRVFGEPLRKSLKYASVAISMADEDGKQYIWGYVPVVVAKVGLFLKENATEVEGVFRIAGSQKRMRELQETFDTPPKYGKQLTWERYSVHDAASVLRRYLNQMPEPIVPLQLYNEFRNAMHKQPMDVEAATRTYRLLIQAMPPANRYLLLYVLDLLAVFARKSEQNRMPASNLAVIFQPGIFSHPSHLSDANEHKAAVEVLEFLIEHQDHFVLGISPPPPTNVGPSELTQVSLPLPEPRPDVADLSESDEELGELVVHEGGGAALAKRRGSDVGQSTKRSGKSGGGALGIFRSRSARQNSKSSTSPLPPDNVATSSSISSEQSAAKEKEPGLALEPGRTPAPAEGEIHEVGLGEIKNNGPQIVTAQVRRSKTLPHGRRGPGKDTDGSGDEKRPSRDEQRSVSAGKPSLEAPAMAKSASTATPVASAGVRNGKEANADKAKLDKTAEGAEAVEPATAAEKPTDIANAAKKSPPLIQSDLPTPPSSKVLPPAPTATDI